MGYEVRTYSQYRQDNTPYVYDSINTVTNHWNRFYYNTPSRMYRKIDLSNDFWSNNGSDITYNNPVMNRSFICVPSALSKYDLTVKVSSPNGSSGAIGLILGSYVSASHVVNLTCTVRAIGQTSYFRVTQSVFNNGVLTDTVLYSFTGFSTKPSNWSNQYSTIHAVRNHNKIEVACSNFNSDSILPASKITIDLEALSALEPLRTSSTVGFYANTQALAQYHVVSFNGTQTFNDQLIVASDGNIDESSTSLDIVGYKTPNFSKPLFQNNLKLLENFSNSISPNSASIGQLWFNSSDDSFYIYTKLTDGTTGWVSLTSEYYSKLENHDQDLSNPHNVTKVHIGLPLVDNVLVFDKSRNFGDVDSTQAATIRTNIDIYGKSEVYTKTQSNSRFLGITAKSVNSNLLDGLPASVFVKSNQPTGANVLQFTQSGKAFTNSTGDFNIGLGTTRSYIGSGVASGVSTSLSVGGAEILFNYKNQAPKIDLVLYGQSNLGDTAPVVKKVTFDNNGLLIDDTYRAYHTYFKPTASEIGALPVNGTAVNSNQLNGKVLSAATSANTIAVRTSTNIVSAFSYIVGDTQTVSMNANDQLLIKNPINEIVPITRQATWNLLGLTRDSGNSAIPIAIGAFNGVSSTPIISKGCTISKISTGRYLVTLSSAYESESMTPIIGNVDNKSAPFTYAIGTDSMILFQSWASDITNNSFIINVKRTSNYVTYSQTYYFQYYYDTYIDADYVSFEVFGYKL